MTTNQTIHAYRFIMAWPLRHLTTEKYLPEILMILAVEAIFASSQSEMMWSIFPNLEFTYEFGPGWKYSHEVAEAFAK